MGRSAKLHKRVVKKTVKQKEVPPPAPSPSVVQSAKKRAGLKSKAKAKTGERVLGGADYVTLQLGSRRKAVEEARKLPS